MHNCHGTVGLQNEYCNYPKNKIDKILRQEYDMKNEIEKRGKTYVFAPVSKKI